MLRPHVATKHLFLLGMTIAWAAACGEPAPTTPDSDAGIEGDPCNVCGGSHLAGGPSADGGGASCASTWAACTADPGCRAIIGCVFKPTHDASASDPGCPIAKMTSPFAPQYDAAGACVGTCIQKHCDGSAHSAELYLAAERCSYCGAACSGVCGAYCAALPATGTCGGTPDAATD